MSTTDLDTVGSLSMNDLSAYRMSFELLTLAELEAALRFVRHGGDPFIRVA